MSKVFSILAAAFAAVVIAVFVEGCGGSGGHGGGGSAPPPPPTTTSISAVARGGSNQAGTAGQTLPEPLQVKVLNQSNYPVVGASVTLNLTTGTGHFTGKGYATNPLPSGNLGTTVQTTTDANGDAETFFFAPGPGTNVITVSATSGSLNHTGLTFTETGF